MRKSIASRYFYSTATLLLCSISVMGFIQMYLAMGYFGNEKTKSLLNTIEISIKLVEDAFKSAATSPEVLVTSNLPRELWINSKTSESVIILTDNSGNPLFMTDPVFKSTDTAVVPKRALEQAKSDGIYEEMGTLGGFFPRRFYVVGKPIVTSDNQTIAYVFAATDSESLGKYLSDMFSSFILSAGLMLLISCILSLMLTTRTTTPLRRIAEAARKFGHGDFKSRVPVEGDDEVAQLALTFNNMASSLEKNDMSRRSFMGNIAHELRTPMTSIKGFIDGMLDGTIPKECHEHYLEIVSQESGRLTRLIKNMLDITKLEAGEYKVNAAPYDIWETLTGVAFGSQTRLEANEITMEGLTPTKTIVYADADLVYQVVYNITDNAIKFCNVGGYVRYTVTPSKGFVTVSIRNSGVGIDKDALPFVFERFYKEDKSRGLNTTGSGLGLHICKVLINLSGGKIWVDSQEGEYCEFSFTLPTEAKK